MSKENNGNHISFNIQNGQNQINLAADEANITATQNNSLDIKEINALLENVLKSLPQDLSNEKREEVKENLTLIKTEVESQNPRKLILKNTLTALKAIASTAGFVASLAKIAEHFKIPIF